MTKRQLVLRSGIFGVWIAVLAALVPDVASAAKKVTVCHIPPGNPGNQHTISVGESAVSAHLAHGDELGPCVTDCRANASLCDDDDACTSDSCDENGQCTHEPVNCDDGNRCTRDVCDPANGCIVVADQGAACDDGNACTGGDVCAGTICAGTAIPGCCGTSADCDDGVACTVDVCSNASCTNEAADCGVADKCLAGFCDPTGGCSATPVSCDDSNFCTDDACDSVSGCTHQPTTTPPEASEASCADGLDNDCDGAVDGADPDCGVCGDGVAAVLDVFNPTSSFTKEGGESFTPGQNFGVVLTDDSGSDFVSFFAPFAPAAAQSPGTYIDAVAFFQVLSTAPDNADAGCRVVINDGAARSAIAACVVLNGIRGIGLLSQGAPSAPTSYPVFVPFDWVTASARIRLRRYPNGDAELVDVNGVVPNPPALLTADKAPGPTRSGGSVEFGAASPAAQCTVGYTVFRADVVQPGEECDDGNTNPFDGCDLCRFVDTSPD